MTRRGFIARAALLPPLPGLVLRSPKHEEQVASLRKVRSVAVEVVRAPQVMRSSLLSVLSIRAQGGLATISWEGGTPPFKLEQKTGGGWVPVGNPTLARERTVVADQPQASFRIQEAVLMPLTVELQADGVRLTWVPPEG